MVIRPLLLRHCVQEETLNEIFGNFSQQDTCDLGPRPFASTDRSMGGTRAGRTIKSFRLLIASRKRIVVNAIREVAVFFL